MVQIPAEDPGEVAAAAAAATQDALAKVAKAQEEKKAEELEAPVAVDPEAPKS